MQKRKIIKDKKFINKLKNKYAKIPMWTNEIVCKGEVIMQKEIWTNKQQAYLDNKFDSIDKKFDAIDQRFEAIDKKFEAVDQRFNKLENQVKQNADGINQIIQILARSGMR